MLCLSNCNAQIKKPKTSKIQQVITEVALPAGDYKSNLKYKKKINWYKDGYVNKTSYYDFKYLKSISEVKKVTRSGIKFILNDGEGSILIEDPSGNTWKMDGQGNIDVNAPKTFSVNAADINLSASKNISVNAGMNISESAGGDKSTTVGLMHTLSIGVDYMVNVTGKLFENVIGERKSQSKKIINNHESHEMNIEKNKNVHTEGEFKINSTEKSNMF